VLIFNIAFPGVLLGFEIIEGRSEGDGAIFCGRGFSRGDGSILPH